MDEKTCGDCGHYAESCPGSGYCECLLSKKCGQMVWDDQVGCENWVHQTSVAGALFKEG
jgi:hypothetical protein